MLSIKREPTWTSNEIITNSTQKRLGKLNFAITFNTNYINLKCTTVCLYMHHAQCIMYPCITHRLADAHKFLQNIHMLEHYARLCILKIEFALHWCSTQRNKERARERGAFVRIRNNKPEENWENIPWFYRKMHRSLAHLIVAVFVPKDGSFFLSI